ncbi:hypothetical protein Mal15_26690 [Stieleria maiorica]|uniref:Uncharacterized protein n=1 Tax=Stieleria maiorica TaxID=2795974 RepID=A0A5B9MGA6_9BACT|nr:hypothetical protein [Stieleria maiorica]QEF98614.1 hypothetical protein Mal15_26690 [Stieleria maiorica]
MSKKKRQRALRREIQPLVELSDRLGTTRLHSARIRVRRSELQLKRERVRTIPGERSALSTTEFTARINRLADRLRENRRRIGRIRRARQREVQNLLGAEFTYLEIARSNEEFSLYAGYFGGNE